ncbi:WD domain G-beta repeat protein [Theileria parva strain Muguga]|uniref:Uncharacterized protein n=1 Tax=Theileria parva TaxID=5875 RepID=Q4N147_THEPA|nr:WD domain G-beta repeat protein [Theileria parva strain Muguga]EAN32256.1 WD domain G-beta repeat protein [Theileria parva strain Muguga]|eukprot:XP_764539.1 hypothetical protein [Theileria parva strain Muguga]
MESLYEHHTMLKPQNSFGKGVNDLPNMKSYMKQRSINFDENVAYKEIGELGGGSSADETEADECYIDSIRKGYQTRLKSVPLFSKYTFKDSVIPVGDPKHHARKSALYNRTECLEAHYIAHFDVRNKATRLTEELKSFNKSGSEDSEESETNEEFYSFEKIIEEPRRSENSKIDSRRSETSKIDSRRSENSKIDSRKSLSVKFSVSEVENKRESVNPKNDESHDRLDKFIADLGDLQKINQKNEEPSKQDANKEPIIEQIKMKAKQEEFEVFGDSDKSFDLDGDSSYDNRCSTQDDEVNVFYVSKDKNFLITGTLEGFVNVWALLSPFTRDELDHLTEDETYNTKNKKILRWSSLGIEPDLSFKAHEAGILSVQIMPKSFDNNKSDHVLVTTSYDKKLKVWRLSNLCKISNKRNFNVYGGSHDRKEVRKRTKKIKIQLLGQLEMIEDEFVEAVYIPILNEIIVTSFFGTIEKFKLLGVDNGNRQKRAKNSLVSVTKVTNEDNHVTVGSLSTGHNYYAIGTQNGEVKVYDVKDLSLVATFMCRNNKGFNKEGRTVSGIEWNKKENFILVTTMDSRIRLLSLTNSDSSSGISLRLLKKEKKLEFVEKFKGHINKRRGFKARFLGTNEEFVICPCETGRILIWCIVSPSYYPEEPLKEEVEDRELPVKNKYHITFKIKDKYLLENMNIYNLCEWEKLFKIIKDYRKELDENMEQQQGCLVFRRPKEPENKYISPVKDILLISATKDNELKFSGLDINYFQ